MTASALATTPLLWPLVAALAVATQVMVLIAYAKRRGMLDQPGGRRLHGEATPRGAGIAIVTTLVAFLLARWGADSAPAWTDACVAGAMVLVAAIGFADDHQAIPALLRLLVQTLAALLLAVGMSAGLTGSFGLALAIVAAVLLAVALVNAWNFIDGANGMAALQAVGVAALAALLALNRSDYENVAGAGLILAAVLAFLPFNFPRAVVFLGDAGSGSLGLLMAWLMGSAWLAGEHLAVVLMLPAVVVTDTTLTLLLRLATGRRWYIAHRSHLYQWLIRRGRSHAAASMIYFGVHILLVAPFALVAQRQPALAWPALAGLASLLITLWFLGRRKLLAEAAIWQPVELR